MDYIEGELVEGGEIVQGAEAIDLRAYPIFADDECGVYSGTFSVVDGSRVADVTRERIAEVLAWHVEEDHDGGATTDLKLLVRLDDGSYAACMADCDYTGWDCQAGAEWRWAPSEELIVTMGIDRAARALLGRPLAIDGKTSGTVA